MLTFRELKADMAILQYERTDLKEKFEQLNAQYQKQKLELMTERDKNVKLEKSFKEYKVRSEDERDGLATCLRQQALTKQLNTTHYKEFEIQSFSKKISTLEVGVFIGHFLKKLTCVIYLDLLKIAYVS